MSFGDAARQQAAARAQSREQYGPDMARILAGKQINLTPPAQSMASDDNPKVLIRKRRMRAAPPRTARVIDIRPGEVTLDDGNQNWILREWNGRPITETVNGVTRLAPGVPFANRSVVSASGGDVDRDVGMSDPDLWVGGQRVPRDPSKPWWDKSQDPAQFAPQFSRGQFINDRTLAPEMATATETDIQFARPDEVESEEEARTQDEMEAELYRMSDKELRALQERLERAGLLTKGQYGKGIPDEETLTAYQTVLTRAANYYKAGNQVTLDEVIDASIRAYEEDPERGPKREPFIARLADPMQLKEAVRKVSSIVAGENLPDSVLESIWMQYRAEQYREQRQEYDMRISGTSGSVDQLAPFETYATAKVRAAAPEKAGAQDLAARASEFFELLGGD
jgi:hypothetical protein